MSSGVTSAAGKDRSRLRLVIGLFVLVSVMLMTLNLAGADGFGVDGIVCLGSLPFVLFLVHRSSPHGVLAWLMTPAGVVIGFLWTSVLAVPILWALGVATPWLAYPQEQSLRIVLTAIGSVFLIHIGSLMGGQVPRSNLALGWGRPAGMRKVLIASVVAIIGCFAVLQLKVGIAFLLANLLTKRDLLAGLGPVTAIAAATGVAGLAAWSTRDLCRNDKVLAAVTSSGYLAYLFVLGSRLPMIVYLVAIAIARASAGRIPRALIASVAVGAIPFAVWYSVSVRKGQLIDDVGGGIRGSAKSVIDPFTYGGLDVLNTFGAVISSVTSDFAVHVELLLANATTMVPRFLWPSKPPGVSVVFSEQFFERQWLSGSGVPPSIIAELVFAFGIVGGMVAMPILGFLLTRASIVLSKSQRPFLRLLYPLLTVDFLVLAKSGTDAFLQQLSIHVTAVLVFSLLVILFGAGAHVDERKPSDP